jgi:hypothetical protein
MRGASNAKPGRVCVDSLIHRRRRFLRRFRPASCSARTCRSVTGRASEERAGTPGENDCGIRRALTAECVLPRRAAGFLRL